MKQIEISLCKLCCAREAEKNNPQGWCSRCEAAYIEEWLDDALYKNAKTKRDNNDNSQD